MIDDGIRNDRRLARHGGEQDVFSFSRAASADAGEGDGLQARVLGQGEIGDDVHRRWRVGRENGHGQRGLRLRSLRVGCDQGNYRRA